ncbi:MAG: hypothetical protein JO035_14090 [Betaproteobacteria bacterium]|nr:hypothetical protein [Betaproteobacteria bacterium]
MVAGMLVGTFFSFLLGIFNPLVANKAGPDWLWMGGREDVLRNLYFRRNGSFRRYGRPALVLTLILGSAAFCWLLQRFTA